MTDSQSIKHVYMPNVYLKKELETTQSYALCINRKNDAV